MKTLKNIFKSAEDLFDRKMKNWTVMVVIISTLITATWFLTNTVNAGLTANVLQSQKNTEINQYIIISWKKYQIILKEVK